MRLPLITFALSVSGQTALAACGAPDQTYMSCTLNNGAEFLDVCLVDEVLHLSRGPVGGAAQLALSVPAAEADFEPWPRINSFNERVVFQDGALARLVWVGEIRVYGEEEVTSVQIGGMESLRNYEMGDEELLEGAECDPGSVDFPAYGVLESLKRVAGLCWDGYSNAWVACDGG